MSTPMSLALVAKNIIASIHRGLDDGQPAPKEISMDGTSKTPLSEFLREARHLAKDEADALFHRLDNPPKPSDKPWLDTAAVARRTGDSLLADIVDRLKHGGAICARVATETGPHGLASYLELLKLDRTSLAPRTSSMLGLGNDATLHEAAVVVLGRLRGLGILTTSTEDGVALQNRREREVKAGLESYQSRDPSSAADFRSRVS